MDTGTNKTIPKRALLINFDLYAEDDQNFKRELIDLMVANLRELRQAYCYSIEQQNLEFFSKACHKVKTTLSMLSDKELDNVVEGLKNSSADQNRVSLFNNLSAEIIASLLNERIR